MNERPLVVLVLIAAILAGSCAPPSPAGPNPEELQQIETQVSITAHIAHDTALLFALASLRAGDPDTFERAIEDAVDRNAVNLGLLLLTEGEAKVVLSEPTTRHMLCHLHMVKAYRDQYPFDSDFDTIETAVKRILARLPQLPENLAQCSNLLPPLDTLHASSQVE